ncbi:MAG: MFS transporter [Firmicutes bacterium]|nr:MFS transporter [Bacillota bacterium]
MSDSPVSSKPMWTMNFLFLILANFGVYVVFYMMIPCLPIFVKEITGQDSLTGLALAAFIISSMLFRPFAGRQVDSGNRKRYFLFGAAVLFASSLVLGLAPTMAVLFPARIVQGLGWAYCNTAATTMAVDIIPRPRLAEGLGYYSLSLGVAMGLGPALGLFAMQRYGSQVMFYVSAGFVLFALLLALLIKHHQEDGPKAPPPLTLRTLVERRALMPSLMMFIAIFAYAAIISFLPLYAQQRQVGDAAGLFFIVYAVSITAFRPLTGLLADRRGFAVVIIPGLLVCIMSMFIIYAAHSLAVFILAAVIFGAGFGALQTMQALTVSGVPPERRGAATATYYVFMDLGLGVASTLWGIVAHLLNYGLMYLLVIIPLAASLLMYLFIERSNDAVKKGGGHKYAG